MYLYGEVDDVYNATHTVHLARGPIKTEAWCQVGNANLKFSSLRFHRIPPAHHVEYVLYVPVACYCHLHKKSDT